MGGAKTGLFSASLEAGLEGISGKPALQLDAEAFKYLEIDIRETKDHEIVVYHGGPKGAVFIGSTRKTNLPWKGDHATVPYENSQHNKDELKKMGVDKSWKKIKVRDLKKSDLQKFLIEGDYEQHIPELSYYLKKSIDYGIQCKLMVEVKDVYTAIGRKKLLDALRMFMKEAKYENPSNNNSFNDQKLGLIVRTDKKEHNFDKQCSSLRKDWCIEAKSINIDIYEFGNYESICDLSQCK